MDSKNGIEQVEVLNLHEIKVIQGPKLDRTRNETGTLGPLPSCGWMNKIQYKVVPKGIS